MAPLPRGYPEKLSDIWSLAGCDSSVGPRGYGGDMTNSASALHAGTRAHRRRPARAVAAVASTTAPRIDTVYTPPFDLDFRRVVGIHRRGQTDPTMRWEGNVLWRSVRTPLGAGTIALRQEGGAIRASAWGEGAAWLIDQLPALCGAHDDPSGFDPSLHPLITESARRNPGMRLGRSDLLADALMSSILEQKVTALQAFHAWRDLIYWHGERAPGPRRLWVAPALERWRRIPSWDWHRAGVEPPQSRAAVTAAASDLGERLATAATGAERERLLTTVRGIGVWTAAEVRIRAYGDPDAVSFGDFHLAHEVGFALTGERVDDDGMRALLEPWAGHRQRVIRLIFASGVVEPRRAPRLHPEDHRAR